ncbi:unnamed protein product [Adineta steineri]|uniref:Uncharacterized protein n=3 Tax=Adineta steineri TaxID=433720 RepID=A0A816BI84_9BILA|nr:unnamed protein product [Adineta steineri]CAF1609542.1 unnamed protein product [Adineta steineri]
MSLISGDNGFYETRRSFLNRKNLLKFLIVIIFLSLIYVFIFRENLRIHINFISIKLKNSSLIKVNLTDVKEVKIKSPFYRTLGFIRWNAARLERIPVMEKYRPFFAELHYSIPGHAPKVTYTADGSGDSFYIYKEVSDTMEIILKDHPMIEGLLYFHFDAWINPFRFDNMNFNHIWFPDSALPPFRCVTNTAGWDWWAWGSGYHTIAKQATANVAKNYSNRFITDKDVFCGGWSDIYYIPRRFFRDFIDLTSVFYPIRSFHEVGIPTMINIIDLTHRLTPSHSIVTRIADCWGHCCAGGSSENDIKQKRCGHRMDLANEGIKKTLINLLESEASYLNKTISKKIK